VPILDKLKLSGTANTLFCQESAHWAATGGAAISRVGNLCVIHCVHLQRELNREEKQVFR
jgi:hypothetical protein